MSDFERFWSAYPRKVGKLAALKVWQRLNPHADLVAVMLEAIEAQRRSPQWLDNPPRFIPHPVTWLRQGRWLDQARAPVYRTRFPDSHLCRHEPPCTSDRMHANALAMGREG